MSEEKLRTKIRQDAGSYRKRDTILFPMDDAKLSDAKQRELIESFEKYEEEIIGKGKHEELHTQLEAFKAQCLE